MGVEQQPSRKVFNAVLAAKAQKSFDTQLANLKLEDQTMQAPKPDRMARFNGELLYLRIQEVIIQIEFKSCQRPILESASQRKT